jgi:hypothetical protein
MLFLYGPEHTSQLIFPKINVKPYVLTKHEAEFIGSYAKSTIAVLDEIF